jgi:TonB family protein
VVGDIKSETAQVQNVYKFNASNYFRGRVVDANNNALPFANITNTRDNIGTYSDAKGNFTLLSHDTVLDVQVKSVGFENATAQLRNGAFYNNVVLQEDRKALNEVVISNKKMNSTRSGQETMKFEEPEPADGWYNYDVYIVNNINLPTEVKTRRTTGQVQLSFDVTAKGEPINIKIEKSLCKECDEEAIRLVKEGPKWKSKSKRKQRVTVTVPFEQ